MPARVAGQTQPLAGAGLGGHQAAADQLDRGQVLQGLGEQPDRALLPGPGHGPGVQGVAGVDVADEEGGHPGPQEPARVLEGAGEGDRPAQQRLPAPPVALGHPPHPLEQVAEELARLVDHGQGGGPPAELGRGVTSPA